MKTLALVLLISTCVALSMATGYKTAKYPGTVNVASPRSGYSRPNHESFASAAQVPTNPQELHECANQNCGNGMYNNSIIILCHVANCCHVDCTM